MGRLVECDHFLWYNLGCVSFTLEETVFDRPKIDRPDEITERETKARKQSPEPQTEKSGLEQLPSDHPSELPAAEANDKPKTYWAKNQAHHSCPKSHRLRLQAIPHPPAPHSPHLLVPSRHLLRHPMGRSGRLVNILPHT